MKFFLTKKIFGIFFHQNYFKIVRVSFWGFGDLKTTLKSENMDFSLEK